MSGGYSFMRWGLLPRLMIFCMSFNNLAASPAAGPSKRNANGKN